MLFAQGGPGGARGPPHYPVSATGLYTVHIIFVAMSLEMYVTVSISTGYREGLLRLDISGK